MDFFTSNKVPTQLDHLIVQKLGLHIASTFGQNIVMAKALKLLARIGTIDLAMSHPENERSDTYIFGNQRGTVPRSNQVTTSSLGFFAYLLAREYLPCWHPGIRVTHIDTRIHIKAEILQKGKLGIL